MATHCSHEWVLNIVLLIINLLQGLFFVALLIDYWRWYFQIRWFPYRSDLEGQLPNSISLALLGPVVL